MHVRTIGIVAAVAMLFSAFAFVGQSMAQASDAGAAPGGDVLFARLGCASCHGAPGGGGTNKGSELARSALPRLSDGGQRLYDFMGDMEKGHPDLNGPRAGAGGAIAAMSRAEAEDVVASVRASWDKVRGRQGRQDAPAIIAASGTPCRMTDASYFPVSDDKKTRTEVDAYELACDGAIGRVVIRTAIAGKPEYEVRDCFTASIPMADGRPNTLTCALPANLDLLAQLRPYIDESGVSCDLKQARALGGTAEAFWVEAACAGDSGYLVGLPRTLDPSKPVTARNCLVSAPGAPDECRLTSRAAMLAGATAPLLSRAAAPCEVTARRYVARSMGNEYYEIACASGAGFMLVADARGGFKSKVACANAEDIAGGCSLTDLKAARTADNARYAALVRAAGYDCAVSGYRPLAIAAQDETVEIACGNRPDGAIAQFPRSGPAVIFNCAAAETTGFRCGLTKPDAAYARLTAAVKKSYPASTCQVSASRFLGVTPDSGFVEVACADKDPGYVLQYAKATAQPTEALYCSRLKAQLGGVTCGLPTNMTK